MKTRKQIHLLFAITLFAISACSEIDTVKPSAASKQETIVLVQNYSGGALRALDGQNGNIKWIFPENTIGKINVDSKTLYVNQQNLTPIKYLTDTVNLYKSKAPQNLISINGSNGKATWRVNNMLKPPFFYTKDFDTLTRQWSQLIKIEDGIVFMELVQLSNRSPSSSTIYATDLRTGVVKWTFVFPNPNIDITSATVYRGRMVCGNNDHTYLLDLVTGNLIKEYQFGGGHVFVDDQFFVGGSQDIVSVNTKSGAIVWENPLVKVGGGALVGMPLADKNLVYIVTAEGVISAIDMSTGERKWMFKVYPVNATTPYQLSIQAGALIVSPTDVSKYVRVSGSTKVYALDLATGEKKWDVLVSDLSKTTTSQPIETKNRLVYAITNLGLAGIDSKTGQKMWHRDTPTGEIINSFYVYDKTELDF